MYQQGTLACLALRYVMQFSASKFPVNFVFEFLCKKLETLVFIMAGARAQLLYIKTLTCLRGLGTNIKEIIFSFLDLAVIPSVLSR